MKKPVFNLKNKSVGDIDLDTKIFGIKIFPDLIHQYIRYQNAKSRQGSHKTKSRSEVNGRSKKPFAQKGTGNARQGSNKPPNFRGGAVSMGPVNRDQSFSLNKKEKKLALKSALSSKFVNTPAKSPALTKIGPEVILMFTLSSFAIMFASVVLPKPGGP